MALAMASILLAAVPTLAEGPDAYFNSVLQDSRGARTSLSGLAAGQPLVVVVLKGAWCRVCMGQLQAFATQRKQLSGLGARVVGLSADSPTNHRAAIQRTQLPYPIASDPRHSVLRGLGLWRPDWGHPLPAVIVFDRCGTERGRIEGRSPGERTGPAVLKLLRTMAKTPAQCGGLQV